MKSTDYYLGRTYTFTPEPQFARGFMVSRAYGLTVVGVDPKRRRLRVHAEDGSRAWFSLATFDRLQEAGAVCESRSRPFVWGRT